MFSGLTPQHHHFVAFQINMLSEPSETCLPIPESYDNTEKERMEKEYQELWAYARRGPTENRRALKK